MNCAHVSHPIFVAEHPQTMWIHQGDKIQCPDFLDEKSSPGQISQCQQFSWDDSIKAAVLVSYMHVPHKQVSKET